LKSLIIKTE
jgi:hypothetical protein